MSRLRSSIRLLCLAVSVLAAAAAEQGPTVVEGTITGPAGAPLEGARVALGRWDRDEQRTLLAGEATTGADGRFRIEVKGSKGFAVRVEAPGLAHASTGTDGGTVGLKLDKGGVIEGTVFDLDGRPVAGAIVEATVPGEQRIEDPAAEGRFALRATSDRTGRYRLADVPFGTVQLRVTAPAKRTAQAKVQLLRETPVSRPFYLEAGTTISGKVVDPDGKPVEGARLRAFPVELMRSVDMDDATTRTKSDGSFEIAGVPDWSGAVLTVEHPKFARALTGEIALAGRSRSGLVIPLERGATIAAQLVTGDKPAAGKVGLTVNYDGKGPFYTRIVERGGDDVTFADGKLSAPRFAAGTATISVSLEGLKPVTREKVLIKPNEVLDLGTLSFEAGAGITGRVVDREGKPLEGADVSATGFNMQGRYGRGWASTKADGSFAMAGLTAGITYKVVATKKGVGSAHQESVPLDGPALTLTVEPYGKVSGRVKAGNPPAPVSLFTVEAVSSSGGGGMESFVDSMTKRPAKSVRDAGGAFTLDDLSPDTYTVTITSPGFVPKRLEKVGVTGSATADLADVTLEKGGTLRVIVVDRKTKLPLGGVEVGTSQAGLFGMMSEMSGQKPPVAVTGPDGRVVLEGLPFGHTSLKAEHQRFAPQSVDVEIKPEQPDVDLTVELGSGGTVEGVARDKNGQLLVDYIVAVTSGVGASRRMVTTSDGEGHFKLEHVAPGTYMAVVTPNNAGNPNASQADMLSKLQMQSITVEEGRTARADFPVGSTAGVVVKGRVLEGKTPLESRMFWARANSGSATDVVTAQSGADGSFEVRLSAPGRYIVRAAKANSEITDPGFSVRLEIPDKPQVEQNVVKPEGRVSGTLTDAGTGAPLAGGRITLVRVDANGEPDTTDPVAGQARSGEDGSFTVEGLAKGHYRLSVGLAGHGSFRGDAFDLDEADKQQLSAALPAAIPMTVRVTSGDSPVSGALVAAVDDLYGSFSAFDALTDAEGRLTFKSLGVGSHDVLAIAPGLAPSLRRGVTVAADRNEPLEFALEKGGAVRLRVVDGSDRPVDGAGLRIREKGGGDLTTLLLMSRVLSRKGFSLATDKAGTVALENVEPGEYELQVIRGDETVGRKVVKVTAGATAEVTIKLP